MVRGRWFCRSILSLLSSGRRARLGRGRDRGSYCFSGGRDGVLSGGRWLVGIRNPSPGFLV